MEFGKAIGDLLLPVGSVRMWRRGKDLSAGNLVVEGDRVYPAGSDFPVLTRSQLPEVLGFSVAETVLAVAYLGMNIFWASFVLSGQREMAIQATVLGAAIAGIKAVLARLPEVFDVEKLQR